MYSIVSMNQNNKINFLDGYKINISDIPKYEHFTCKFKEKLDLPLLKLIYSSDALNNKPEIKAQLKNVIDATDKNGVLNVKHYQAKNCGRNYADKNLSLIPLSKYVKHTMFYFLGWIDIDWVKGHPAIAVAIAKSCGGLLPTFTKYINDFDDIVKTLSQFYSADENKPLDKNNIKWLFNSMIYGGGFDSWVAGVSNGDENYGPKEMKNKNVIHSLIKSFKSECQFITNKIYKENPALAKKVANDKGELYEKKNTVASYWFQIIENHVVHLVAGFLLQKGILKSGEFGCEYDGLNIPPCNIPDKALLIDEVNNFVKEQTGFDFKFKFKEYDEEYILHSVIEKRNALVVGDDNDEDDDDEKLKNNKYRFVQDDNAASTLIHDELKGDLYYINKRLFMKYNNIWKEDSDFINDYILNYILKSNICKKNEDKKYVPYNQNIKSAKNVREALLVKVRTTDVNNDDIYNKFHITTKNRICFLDGVLDFKERKFYDWKDINFEYFSTIQINRNFGDYFKNPNWDIINHIKNDMYRPLYGDKLDLALKFLARAITGNKEDKNWGMYHGNRDCGKGVQYGSLKNGFGDYVKPFELGNLLYERSTNTDEVSRKLYWTLDYEFVRLAVSQEIPDPNTNLKVNSTLLKKIMGGNDDLTARRNYDRNDTNFNVDMTLFMLGNHELQIKEKDTYEHCVSFASVNQFKTQSEIDRMRGEGIDERVLSKYKIKDDSIKDNVLTDEWKNAIVYLLYQNYTEYAVDANYIAENADDDGVVPISQLLLNHYDITLNKNDYILCDFIYSVIVGEKKKVDLELKSLGVEKKKSNKRDNTRNKQCFFGIKKIDEEPEVVETEEFEIEEI